MMGTVKGMRRISYVALALSVLMVTATVDSVPDPPAVTPHTVDVKACLRDFVGAFREPRLTCDSDCISAHFPMHLVSLADAPKPKRSSDRILAVYATDPSPPVL
jgi:hypothetical protein